MQGLRCQASSDLASNALQQLSNPLVRDCCATVAATAGALVLVKLAEVLTYKDIIDQVPVQLGQGNAITDKPVV